MAIADLLCQFACVKLESVTGNEVVVIDEGGEILSEYEKNLDRSGMSGVGNVFFKHVLDNQYKSSRVYARSVAAPSDAKWMAMVKKHHAWKVNEPDVYLYGEDIYGVHSIAYGPVAEHETFYAFALGDGAGAFAAFVEVEAYAKRREIPVVPVLFKGRFGSVAEIRGFVDRAHDEPSVLGGEREGVVLRLERGFPAAEFRVNVCKSVRPGHVQTDEHWTRKWRPCRIKRPAG